MSAGYRTLFYCDVTVRTTIVLHHLRGTQLVASIFWRAVFSTYMSTSQQVPPVGEHMFQEWFFLSSSQDLLLFNYILYSVTSTHFYDVLGFTLCFPILQWRCSEAKTTWWCGVTHSLRRARGAALWGLICYLWSGQRQQYENKNGASALLFLPPLCVPMIIWKLIRKITVGHDLGNVKWRECFVHHTSFPGNKLSDSRRGYEHFKKPLLSLLLGQS